MTAASTYLGVVDCLRLEPQTKESPGRSRMWHLEVCLDFPPAAAQFCEESLARLLVGHNRGFPEMAALAALSYEEGWSTPWVMIRGVPPT